MGKSTKMRRFLQKLAVMLAIIMAVPSINMPVDFFGSVTEVYADGKLPTQVQIEKFVKATEDTVESEIYFVYDVGENTPIGTVSLEYSLDDFQYDDETGNPIITEDMIWTKVTNNVPLGNNTLSIPKELKSKSNILIKASYPGDENFEASEAYRVIDFKAPVIESISEIKKYVIEDIPTFSFEITIDEIVRSQEEAFVNAVLTPYTENGYDTTSATDVLSSNNIGLDSFWQDDTCSLKFTLENIESGIYVLQVVCTDGEGNIGNKVVSTPFSTKGILYTNKDLAAVYDGDPIVYNGTEFTPILKPSVLDQEDNVRKNEVKVWLRDIDNPNLLEYTFLQVSDEYGNAVEAVSGSAILAAGEYNIYMSSKDEEVDLLPGVYGTFTVKLPVDVKATATDLTYTGAAQTPTVTLTVVSEDENKKASLQNLLNSIIDDKNISYTFRQTSDADGNVVTWHVASSTVNDAGTYAIYVNSLDDRIFLPSESIGTLKVEKKSDIPVVSGSAISVSVSKDKKKYVVSIDTSCIINANDGELEYSFNGEEFTTENSYEVDADTKVNVQICFADTKNTEASNVLKLPEITTPAASLEPEIDLVINDNGTRLVVVTPKSSLGKNGDISKIEVYCTTDNATPSIDAPIWGLGVTTFVIENIDVTVKAVAVEPGRIMSEVAEQEFTSESEINTEIETKTVTGIDIYANNNAVEKNDIITLNLFDAEKSTISVYGVVNPNDATNKGIWWTVDKEGIVSLSQKKTISGETLKIHALKSGEVTITAYSVEDPSNFKSFIVNVEYFTIKDTIILGEKEIIKIPNPQKYDFQVVFPKEHKGLTAKLTKSTENDEETYLEVTTNKSAVGPYTIWIVDKNGIKLDEDILPYVVINLSVKYKIVYHPNGAKQIKDETFLPDKKAVLKTPVFNGYKFEGWYYDADFKKIVESETINGENVYYIPAGTKGNVDVYAKWSVKPVTVTFKPNYEGANEEDIIQEIKKNLSTKLKKGSFDRKGYGYYFAGWTTKKSIKKVEYLDEQEVIFASDKVLYAVWAEKGEEFTVTLKYDGGVLSEDLKNVWGKSVDGTATYIYGNLESYPTLPTEDDLTKENYIFVGWKLESGADIKNIKGMGGNLTLVACWKGKTFEVKYNSKKKLPNATVSGKMESEKVSYGETWVPLKCEFSAPGYTFVGWAKSPEATEKEIIAETPKKFNYTEDLNLYAVWKAEDQYLYLYSQYGNVSSDYKIGTSKLDDHLLTFTYTYNDVNEKMIKLPTKAQMEADENGFSFAGWFKSKKDDYGNYTGEPTGKKITSFKPGDTTYFAAKWSGKYKVIYHSEDSEVEQKRKINKKVALKKCKTKKGYRFRGWALTENGDVIFKAKQKISNIDLDKALETIPKDYTYDLYAVYVLKQSKYKITIVNKDGVVVGERNFKYSKGINKKSLKKLGKSLSGDFSHFVDLNGKTVSSIKKKTPGDQTLVLVKKGSKVSLTFDKNLNAINTNISGKVSKKTVKNTDELVSGVNKFKANGYVLIGYSKDQNANEPDYYLAPNGEMYLNASATHDGEHIADTYAGETITLYAIWGPEKTYDSYTYSFNMGSIAPDDDGMTSPNYEILYNCTKTTKKINGEVIVILKNFNQVDNKFVLPEPKRVGFKFTGWQEKDSSGKLIKAKEDITNYPTRYLVATWEPMES